MYVPSLWFYSGCRKQNPWNVSFIKEHWTKAMRKAINKIYYILRPIQKGNKRPTANLIAEAWWKVVGRYLPNYF